MAGKLTRLASIAVLLAASLPTLEAQGPPATPQVGGTPSGPPRRFGPRGEDGGGPRPDGGGPRPDRPERPDRPDRAENKGGGGDKGDPAEKMDPAEREKFETVRKALEALTPEQRKRFGENFVRWANLPPDEKKALADQNNWRRRRMAEEIDAAIKEAGLELDPTGRDSFARRYGEERRKLEEQLWKEVDEKRKPLLKEVIAKLKVEFAPGATPAAASPSNATPAPVVADPAVPARPVTPLPKP